MSVPRLSSDQLAIGLLFTAIATLAALAPAQGDTWWLIREGQEILRRGSVSLVDAYSHTADGLFWPNHEWLTEVVFFGAHRVGGMPLITAICAVTILLTWAVSWRLTPGRFDVRFLLFAGAIALSASGWAIRPQIFSMALYLITVVLCLERREKWLPLLFVVWANLHGAVALGLVVLAADGAARTWAERRVPWQFAAIAATCAAATLVSPLGWRLWTFIPASMERSRINQLVEWLPPDFAPLYLPFWIMGGVVVIFGALRARYLDSRSLELTAIAVATLPLAVQARRNVPVFLLVAVPALGALIENWRPAPPTRSRRPENLRLNGAIVSIVAVGACAGIAVAWSIPAGRLGWTPISQAAVTAVRSCEGPLYNTYADGGVLIWFVPEGRVFIDNRQDPYPPELLKQNRQLEMTGDYQETFDTYHIHCAVIPSTSIVARRLHGDGRWARVFADSQWTVFERAAPRMESVPFPPRP